MVPDISLQFAALVTEQSKLHGNRAKRSVNAEGLDRLYMALVLK